MFSKLLKKLFVLMAIVIVVFSATACALSADSLEQVDSLDQADSLKQMGSLQRAEPYWLPVRGMNGTHGYARSSEFDRYNPSTPQEAVLLQPRPFLIPVYAADGVTLIDAFMVGSLIYVNATPEERAWQQDIIDSLEEAVAELGVVEFFDLANQ